VVTFGVLWWIWRKPRRPGVIGAWFLIVYGVGRIATELIRLPDTHFASPRLLGLSRGQWLSALMIVGGGALLLWIARRSKAERIGGWLHDKRGRADAATSPERAADDHPDQGSSR